MKVWDLPTRLYHWLQALLCLGLLASGFSGNGPHEIIGIALLVLVLWRFCWGVIGSDTSRFKHFLRSPITVWYYLTGKIKHTIGHNPAGGWMVITLLTCLLIQSLTGFILMGVFDIWINESSLFADNDLIGFVHALSARLLIALIGLHLLAIISYKLKHIPLVKAMFTGKQSISTDLSKTANSTQLTSSNGVVFKQNRLAFCCFLICMGVVYSLLKMTGIV